MERREFIKLGVWAATLPFLKVQAVEKKKSNLLFIIADDCTFRDIGCYGGQAYTPNIDKLASEGMRFTQCFQAAPMCSPTRHNIYTGQYPVKTGAYPNHTFAKEGTKSVVHYLKPLGYRVALSGKRHIAPEEVFPFEYLPGKKNPDFKAVERFIRDCKDNDTPFNLYLCSNEPHSPWDKGDTSQYDADKMELPPTFVDTPETRENMTRYLAEITYFDGQVGQALSLLDKYNLSDNTLVILVSEQGSSFPFGKWTCYDTGLQSACIARWPRRIQAGKISDALIEYSDILPTFVEAAGGISDPVLDGKSLLPVLLGEKETHKEYVFGEMTTRGINNGSDYYGIRSVRSKQFKYVWNFTPEVPFKNACVESDIFQSWIKAAEAGNAAAADKVKRYQYRPGEELYDVQKDPYEWNNLAERPEYAEIKKKMRTVLLNWMETMGDKGQQTELEAYQHQVGKRAAKRKGAEDE